MVLRLIKQPKVAKDLHAELFGYARPSGIKRRRKRAIERLRMQAMTPYQRLSYKACKVIAEVFAKVDKTFEEVTHDYQRSN